MAYMAFKIFYSYKSTAGVDINNFFGTVRIFGLSESYDDTPAQAESLLHSLERAAGSIGFYDNADKTEFMCLNQRGDISTLNRPLKLVDKFTYLGSSISSTENDINSRLEKVWKAIDRLVVIWKSDLSNKIKCSFS